MLLLLLPTLLLTLLPAVAAGVAPHITFFLVDGASPASSSQRRPQPAWHCLPQAALTD
jgi:hypothetical protein